MPAAPPGPPPGPGRPAGSCSPSPPSSTRSVPPVDERSARDVAGRVHLRRAAVGPPAEVEDADAGSPEILGQPLGRGEELRAGQATHRRYHTAVVDPSLPDPEKLAAVREAIPALGAGIYLNTGSVGPLPAETAAAMADMAAYERDVGRRHADYFEEFLGRMARGPGRRRGRPRHGRRGGRADPCDDRRHERRDAAARLARGRPAR